MASFGRSIVSKDRIRASSSPSSNSLIPSCVSSFPLEAESIHIIREAVAQSDNPVMLYSIGKDSSVLLRLARKALSGIASAVAIKSSVSAFFADRWERTNASGCFSVPEGHQRIGRLRASVSPPFCQQPGTPEPPGTPPQPPRDPTAPQLSVIETRREGGKVRHEHVASLGSITAPPTVANRVEYWQALHQRLGRLTNRLDGEMQAKILGAVHARVPMPTVEEIHVLNLEEAKQHEVAWRMRHLSTEAIVEENKLRLKAAERLVAEGEPLVTAAAEQVRAAEGRRVRIERGESVPLPGKPPTLKELGITPAHAEHALALAALTPEQFERFLKFGRRPSDYRRRDYAELRRFLRAEARRNQ